MGAAAQLPPSLTPQEQIWLEKAHLPYSVGVYSRCPSDVYTDRCVTMLKSTHLFTRVDRKERFSEPPDLLVQASCLNGGTATIPFNALLSFGAVPSECKESWGIDFEMMPSTDPESRVSRENRCRIRYWHKGTTLLGMKAWFLVLTGDWSEQPYKHPRVYKHVALAILDHTTEIERIASLRSQP